MAVQPQTAAQPQSQAVTQPQATAQPQPQPVKPQEAVAEPAVSPISDESGQSPSASAEDGNAPDNTFEITIKFNAGSFKKKLGALKKKLAPEPRTLEDVNAAMEENRQLQQERSQQRDGSLGENSVGEHESEGKSLLENGTQIAGKAANVVKKFPSLLKKENPAEAGGEILDAPFGAMDAEIATLEGEPAEESLLASKLEDVKSALPQTTKKASKLLTNVIILLFCVGIAYFLASFVTNYVAHQTTVEGESMEPTLSDGDSVIIQRLTYYFKSPERYDVVVFPVHYDNSAGEKTYYIKRVIGLPGETVQIIDGSVYINGSQLTSDKYAVSDIQESGIAEKPLVLGDNQYFVMGDNRNMSTDSRNSYVGLVNKNDIVGEAWLCTWPLSHFGSIKK
jgi:signal peptidase I